MSVIITIIGFTLLKKCKIDAKYRFLVIMGIGLLCLGILVFPLLDFKDNAIKLTNALYYALKSITLNEDIEVLSEINLHSAFGWIYFIWINLFLIALPFFTVSTLIAFIGDLFTDYKFRKLKNKDIYFFSEQNAMQTTIMLLYLQM